MPVTITIRNVPSEVRDELAARAARSGRSLQEFLCATLTEMAARPSVEAAVDAARARAKADGRRIDAGSVVGDRDVERR
jgi:plasmid stability protein